MHSNTLGPHRNFQLGLNTSKRSHQMGINVTTREHNMKSANTVRITINLHEWITISESPDDHACALIMERVYIALCQGGELQIVERNAGEADELVQRHTRAENFKRTYMAAAC